MNQNEENVSTWKWIIFITNILIGHNKKKQYIGMDWNINDIPLKNSIHISIENV